MWLFATHISMLSKTQYASILPHWVLSAPKTSKTGPVRVSRCHHFQKYFFAETKNHQIWRHRIFEFCVLPQRKTNYLQMPPFRILAFRNVHFLKIEPRWSFRSLFWSLICNQRSWIYRQIKICKVYGIFLIKLHLCACPIVEIPG